MATVFHIRCFRLRLLRGSRLMLWAGICLLISCTGLRNSSLDHPKGTEAEAVVTQSQDDAVSRDHPKISSPLSHQEGFFIRILKSLGQLYKPKIRENKLNMDDSLKLVLISTAVILVLFALLTLTGLVDTGFTFGCLILMLIITAITLLALWVGGVI